MANPALITDTHTYTHDELNGAIAHLVSQLKKQNIGPKSKIAFIAKTSPLTIALFFALFQLQAIACPLSYRFTETQIPPLLKQLDATHFLDLTQLTFSPTPLSAIDTTWQGSQLATYLFTSGTSGTPKIACHNLDNHIFSALGALPILGINTDSRYLLSLPLFHVSGISILFRSYLSRCTLVLSDHPLGLRLKAFEITHASLVPTQLYRLLQDPALKLPHLQCALIGGAALSSSLRKEALQRELPLFATYGMTEMSSMITCRKTYKESTDSGALLTHREMKCSPTGELLVRGKTLFQGYWDPLHKTTQRPLIDGWFPTGDLGEQTSDGYWKITGRKDRLFISGGENIQPEEIERALVRLPGIIAAIVRPKPDPEFGERPIAYLLEDTPQYTLESLKKALHLYLPSYKHPVEIFPFNAEMRERIIPK
jgi:O-succinylbenzoic acid--CoA ligase